MGDPSAAAEALWNEVSTLSCVSSTTTSDRTPGTGYFWSDPTTETEDEALVATCVGTADGVAATGSVTTHWAYTYDDYGFYCYYGMVSDEDWVVDVAFDATSGWDPWAMTLQRTTTSSQRGSGSGSTTVESRVDDGELWYSDWMIGVFHVEDASAQSINDYSLGDRFGTSAAWELDACVPEATVSMTEADWGSIYAWTVLGPTHSVDVATQGCGFTYTDWDGFVIAIAGWWSGGGGIVRRLGPPAGGGRRCRRVAGGPRLRRRSGECPAVRRRRVSRGHRTLRRSR